MPEHVQTIASLTLHGVSHRAPAASGGGLSAGAIAIAVVAGLLALACLAWILARALAFEPRWASYARHAVAEAVIRTTSVCAELGDWMRLGR